MRRGDNRKDRNLAVLVLVNFVESDLEGCPRLSFDIDLAVQLSNQGCHKLQSIGISRFDNQV